MRILNLNPAEDVGASSWLVELEGRRLLLDAGAHPAREGRASLPLYGLAGSDEVDAIILSHCHLDHVGSLPLAMRLYPRAHMLTSELSYFLLERVLHNSVNVMTHKRDELGLREYPLYTHDEVDELAPRFQGFRYNHEIVFASRPRRRAAGVSPTVEFRSAGHTLGSAGIMVRGRDDTLFYTGDVSFRDQTLLKGAQFDDIQADVLILETTRGNHPVSAEFSREREVERLHAAILRILRRKGNVLIPAFALGRTQEILALLALMMRSGQLRPQPVYIGGLGRVFTEMYDLEAHRTPRHHSNLRLHEALNLVVLDKKQMNSLRGTGGRLFVLTAGMMSEHTASFELALRMMPEERHGIFFVGYADPQTPGGRLRASRPGKPFLFSPQVEEVTRHCELGEFDLTAHANRDELVEFVGQVSPRAVVLGHGEPPARAWVASAIARRYPKIKLYQPKPGETVEV